MPLVQCCNCASRENATQAFKSSRKQHGKRSARTGHAQTTLSTCIQPLHGRGTVHGLLSRARVHSCKAAADTDSEQEVQIEGIDRNYCNDFVCTSSPQVEQNLKALARDTTRLSTWTSSLFRKDIAYKDALLSFKGIANYKRLKYIKDAIGNPKVLVTKLRMMDKGRACVEWRLRGQVAVFPVDIDFESEFELDLITGKVFSHRERWDLSRLSLLSKLAFLSSRAAWSLAVGAANLKEDTSGVWDKFFSKEESQQSNISADPMDPTKFFQDNNDPAKDLFSIGAIAAFIYLIYQAYSEIEKL